MKRNIDELRLHGGPEGEGEVADTNATAQGTAEATNGEKAGE